MPAILERASLDGSNDDNTGSDFEGQNPTRTKNLGGNYSLVSSQEVDEEQSSPDFSIDPSDHRGEGRNGDSDVVLVFPLDSPGRSRVATSLYEVLHATLLPDDKFTLAGVAFLDGMLAVKLGKFCLLTWVGIAFIFAVVRRVGWEHDPKMRLSDLWLYESNLVVLDSMLFFVVGRLHKQRGVDHIAWMITALAANVYASSITNLPFLRHSVTLYEMHCKWPWKLWVFVGVLFPLIIAIILLHVRRSVADRVFVVKLIELIVVVLIFLIPPLTSDFFHFHHWFAGWVLGMHCNFDVWWSRATMAWCWGLYINGIAAYGRDPLLTCGYAYWLSTDLRCPYVQCYLDALEEAALQNGTVSNSTHVRPMIPPDWRNCSADSYHP
jgi:hypothetical protein